MTSATGGHATGRHATGWAVRAALALRGALLALLVLLLVFGLPRLTDRPAELRLDGGPEDLRRLAGALLAPEPPASIARLALAEPSETELHVLEAAAARSRLLAALPDGPPAPRVEWPESPLAGRAAAIRFHAAAAPGDTVRVRLLGQADVVVDSARVVAGADGAARGAFRVRPGRAGWTEWTVGTAPERTATVRGWVADAEPPRVLVVAGPPSWESRWLVRSLERSGVSAAVVQSLGRGNVVVGGAADRAWWTQPSLARYDVVVLLAGADAGEAALAALEDHVRGGGGALVAGAAALSRLGLAEAVGPERTVDAAALRWTAPAEIVPLPPRGEDGGGRAAVEVRPLREPGRTALVAAATGEGDAVLVLAARGAGRAAGLGLTDTWRWALRPARSGPGSEHADFWRSLVDWLAEPRAAVGVRVEPAEGAVGSTVTLRFDDRPDGTGDVDGEGPAGAPLVLRRPDGTAEPVGGRFVAADTGLHEVRRDGRTLVAFRAVPAGAAPPATESWARLALLTHAAGGAVEEAAAVDPRAGGREGGRVGPPWHALLFLALAALAMAEWTLRRARGLP